jgi:hypothetical protein
MSLLINSFKPNATMRLGSPLNEKTMLIDFDTNEVEEAPVTTTAVKLVEVNPEADTITYSTYPPDELTSINNLETSTALTIHQYDVPGHAERYGFHNQASSQQDPWRIWAYHDDTKLFRQTGGYGRITMTRSCFVRRGRVQSLRGQLLRNIRKSIVTHLPLMKPSFRTRQSRSECSIRIHLKYHMLEDGPSWVLCDQKSEQ